MLYRPDWRDYDRVFADAVFFQHVKIAFIPMAERQLRDTIYQLYLDMLSELRKG